MQQMADEPDEDTLLDWLRDGGGDPTGLLPSGESLAWFAVRRCMPRLLQALLEAGLDPNQANPAREPLLHEAIASFEQSRHGWSGIAVPR
jgi:hypothetical protein